MSDDDSALYEFPADFMTSLAQAERGYCDAQSVLPVDDHYVCHCTCGAWDTTSATLNEGVELARKHTAETDALV
jgi:hypothetical protein